MPWLAASGWLREKQWCYGVNWVVPLNRVAETKTAAWVAIRYAPKRFIMGLL